MIDHRDNIIDLNAILHPGSVYDHPRDVVADPTLSIGEKARDPRIVGVGCRRRGVKSGAAGAAGITPPGHHRRGARRLVIAGLGAQGTAGRQTGAQKIDRAGGIAA